MMCVSKIRKDSVVIYFSVSITLFFVFLGLIKKNSKAVTCGLVFLIYILFAFEKSDADYLEYVRMYQQIGYGSGRALSYELGYVWISKIANNIHMSFEFMRGVVCLFEVGFLYVTAKRFTRNTAMVLALFMVFPAMIDAELFRFLLGMCIVILGLGYLLNGQTIKDYIIYGVTVVLASLFHTSFWIFIIFYLLIIKDRKQLTRIVVITFIVCFRMLGTGVFFNILSHLPIREFVITKYQTGSYANNMGLFVAFVKQMIILSMGLVANNRIYISNMKLIVSKEPLNYNQVKNATNNYSSNLWFNQRVLELDIVAFLLMIPLYYTSSAQRLTHVIIFFNYIALANRCAIEKKRPVYALFTSVIFFLLLIFVESSGAIDAFQSHFTVGYFNNLFQTIFDMIIR